MERAAVVLLRCLAVFGHARLTQAAAWRSLKERVSGHGPSTYLQSMLQLLVAGRCGRIVFARFCDAMNARVSTAASAVGSPSQAKAKPAEDVLEQLSVGRLVEALGVDGGCRCCTVAASDVRAVLGCRAAPCCVFHVTWRG